MRIQQLINCFKSDRRHDQKGRKKTLKTVNWVERRIIKGLGRLKKTVCARQQ